MVCIVVWMVNVGKLLIDKVFIMILFIVLFVLFGFEYCVVNMFMILMGMVIVYILDVFFWIVIGVDLM